VLDYILDILYLCITSTGHCNPYCRFELRRNVRWVGNYVHFDGKYCRCHQRSIFTLLLLCWCSDRLWAKALPLSGFQSNRVFTREVSPLTPTPKLEVGVALCPARGGGGGDSNTPTNSLRFLFTGARQLSDAANKSSTGCVRSKGKKVRVTLEQAMNAQRGSRGIALLFP
jgi:hypothetical protein